MNAAVFVDFDGTITDIDTFDALVRSVAGDAVWDTIDGALRDGRISLREALTRQAAALRFTRAETLAFLESHARVDPAFKPFVAAVRGNGDTIRVVSAGIGTVIHDALERAGVAVDVLANDVDFHPGGWTMTFVDESQSGHRKAVHVHAARASGRRTIYIGDGISDFEAAAAADVRFAKRGRALEAYCRARDLTVTSFDAFDEIERALYP